MEPLILYVSPCGNDTAPGTESAPLASMAGAKQRVRELKKTTSAPITVYFRGGEYRFTEAVTFDVEDSGSADAPVTYRAYPGENVSFCGGIKIDASLVKKAESADVLSRVSDLIARKKLLQIDLSSVTEVIPGIYSYGHTENDSIRAMEIYVNGRALRRSRWPNDVPGSGYLRTAATPVRVNADGTKTIFYDDETAERVNRWSEKSLADLYIFGFLAYDWTNETYDASGIDRKGRSITLKGGLKSYFNEIAPDKRFYFFNLPEEIDEPGESYIDRKERIAYFYPSDDFSADEIYLAALNDDMLQFRGTSHIRIENIVFSYMRGNAIFAENAEDFVLSGCTISHTSAKAAIYNECRKVVITRCEVYDTANGGFAVSGGDRRTLTSGESVIENCVIHAVNRDQSTYGPGIAASSVGMIIRHNHLYDAVHEMIALYSNDILIEYNEIDHCVRESSDMGAIYYGRDPSVMGIVIRYNYFHDTGNDYGGKGQYSIYIDDGNMGADIYGNLFYKAAGRQFDGQEAQAAIMLHCAQFSHIHDNVFMDTANGLRFHDWPLDEKSNDIQDGWYLWLYDRHNVDGSILDKCRKADFDSVFWHNRYDGTIWGNLYTCINNKLIAEYESLTNEQMKQIARDRAVYASNEVDNNVYIRVPVPCFEGKCSEHDNFVSDDTTFFRTYAAGDFSFTEEGLRKVKASAPDFRELLLGKIGIAK